MSITHFKLNLDEQMKTKFLDMLIELDLSPNDALLACIRYMAEHGGLPQHSPAEGNKASNGGSSAGLGGLEMPNLPPLERHSSSTAPSGNERARPVIYKSV